MTPAVPTASEVLSGRYEVHETLGSGGMARVYRGTDRVLGRTVAIKVLSPAYASDAAFVARFRREAQAAARLNHPGVVSIFDTGSDDGTHYIVMEHVAGRTLADALTEEGKLPPGRAMAIAEAVAGALAFAHANGIVHRDVKPANVMLTPQGEAKVMDFGIARAETLGGSLTATNVVLGTAQYLSPEQAQGHAVDARSDVYSLGVVLYHMITGAPPFTADSPVAVAYKHVQETPERPSRVSPDVSPALEAVVTKAMAKDPADRYQTAEELRADLERARKGALEPVTEPRPPERTAVLPPVEAAAPPRRRAWAAIVLGLAVLGLLAWALASVLGGDRGGGALAPQDHRASQASTPSTQPTTSSPSPPASLSVDGAVAALQALVAQGEAGGQLDKHAADEFGHTLDEVTKKVGEGKPDDALDNVSKLREKVGELSDHGDIASPRFAARLDAALAALETALQQSGSTGGEGD